MIFYIISGVVSFAGMEIVAWSAHKYIMHGKLWKLHKDHHRKESEGFLEHNDFFFLIFATPGILALLLGALGYSHHLTAIGVGITLYGFCYFLVHDIFIHQRFKLFRHTKNRYFMAIRRAHKVHHKHLGREHGECFGMLWVPRRFFKTGKSDA